MTLIATFGMEVSGVTHLILFRFCIFIYALETTLRNSTPIRGWWIGCLIPIELHPGLLKNFWHR